MKVGLCFYLLIRFIQVVSANIGPFAVHGIRIFENEKGMFVNMPSNSYKDAQGNTQYEDVFHPVTKEARETKKERGNQNMKKLINSIKNKLNSIAISAKTAIASTSGEGYIDTGVKIIIGVVIGGVILAGLYALFNTTIIPTLTTKIQGMFSYSET